MQIPWGLILKVKLYEYKACSTCQKAVKFLETKKISFERLPIVEMPPSVAELQLMLDQLKNDGGTFKNLFNTSGVQYRELNISAKLKSGMTEQEALTLLSKNGKLIKRPFLLTSKGATVGFNSEIWTKILQKL